MKELKEGINIGYGCSILLNLFTRICINNVRIRSPSPIAIHSTLGDHNLIKLEYTKDTYTLVNWLMRNFVNNSCIQYTFTTRIYCNSVTN